MKKATYAVILNLDMGGGQSGRFFEHVLQAFNFCEIIETSWNDSFSTPLQVMRRLRQKLKQTKRTFSNLDIFMKSQKFWHQISPIIWTMKKAIYTVHFEPGYGGGRSGGIFEHVLQAFNFCEIIDNSWNVSFFYVFSCHCMWNCIIHPYYIDELLIGCVA